MGLASPEVIIRGKEEECQSRSPYVREREKDINERQSHGCSPCRRLRSYS